MIRKFFAASLGLAFALTTVPVAADDDTEEEDTVKINPWRHCGIGAMIFSAEEDEVGAVISNIIWDLGTTAVSSKASSPENCAGEGIKTAMLIQKTYASLSADTARGEGRYLTATLDMMNCDLSVRPALVEDMRANLADILDTSAAKDDTAKAELFYMSLQDDIQAKYKSSCAII